jgi:hypothetical protein
MSSKQRTGCAMSQKRGAAGSRQWTTGRGHSSGLSGHQAMVRQHASLVMLPARRPGVSGSMPAPAASDGSSRARAWARAQASTALHCTPAHLCVDHHAWWQGTSLHPWRRRSAGRLRSRPWRRLWRCCCCRRLLQDQAAQHVHQTREASLMADEVQTEKRAKPWRRWAAVCASVCCACMHALCMYACAVHVCMRCACMHALCMYACAVHRLCRCQLCRWPRMLWARCATS